MKISLYIRELLFTNDFVIIPEFGAIKTRYKTAEYDSESNTFDPPKKELFFDASLTKGDKKLVDYISKKENISEEASLELVTKFVQTSLTKLKQGNKLRLEKLGIFQYDKRGTLRFDPEEKINFLPDSYGFEAIKVETPVQKTEKKGIKAKQVNSKKTSAAPKIKATRTTPQKTKPKSYKAVIIISLIVIIGAWSTIFFATDIFSKQRDSVISYVENLIGKDKPVAENKIKKPKEEIKVNSEEKTAEPEIKEPETATPKVTENQPPDTPTAANQEKPEKEYIEPKVKANSKKRFYLIYGSFSRMDNAQSKMNDLVNQGYSSEVLDKENNMFRVTIGSFDYKNDALIELEKVRKTTGKPDIWLLSR